MVGQVVRTMMELMMMIGLRFLKRHTGLLLERCDMTLYDVAHNNYSNIDRCISIYLSVCLSGMSFYSMYSHDEHEFQIMYPSHLVCLSNPPIRPSIRCIRASHVVSIYLSIYHQPLCCAVLCRPFPLNSWNGLAKVSR